MKAFLIGCVTLIVIGIIALVLLFLFRERLGNWFVGVAFDGIENAIEESQLPEADKQRVQEFVRDLESRYDAGEVDLEAMAMMVGNGAQLMMPGFLHLAVVESLKTSGLSDEEKASAQLAAERTARGGFGGEIPVNEIAALLQSFDGQEQLSDEDLRQLTKDMTALADDNGVSGEGYEVNYAEEIIRALEQALSEAQRQLGK